MTLLALAGAFVLLRSRRWALFVGWAAAFLGSFVLNNLIKRVIHRPRPAGSGAWLAGHSWSFPSGHAMNSLVAFGLLAWLLVVFRVRDRARRVAIVAGCALLALLIGMTRLYLGVHYFSDVVAGWATGIVWLSVCVAVLEMTRRLPRPS